MPHRQLISRSMKHTGLLLFFRQRAVGQHKRNHDLDRTPAQPDERQQGLRQGGSFTADGLRLTLASKPFTSNKTYPL